MDCTYRWQFLYQILLLFAGWSNEGRQIIGRGSTFPANSDLQHEGTYMYMYVIAQYRQFLKCVHAWYDIVFVHVFR